MLRAKRRRTRTYDENGKPIFNTFNSTVNKSHYVMKNNYLHYLKNGCFPKTNGKIPLKGYRKQLEQCKTEAVKYSININTKQGEEQGYANVNGLYFFGFRTDQVCFGEEYINSYGNSISPVALSNLGIFSLYLSTRNINSNALFTISLSPEPLPLNLSYPHQCPGGCKSVKFSDLNKYYQYINITIKKNNYQYEFTLDEKEFVPATTEVPCWAQNYGFYSYQIQSPIISNILKELQSDNGPTSFEVIISLERKKCGYVNEPKNTVYKDNYAKICGKYRKENEKNCAYKNVISNVQNKNGIIDYKYNYNYEQYLDRRCKNYKNLVFNFASNKPIPGSNQSEFLTRCNNNGVNYCKAVYKKNNSQYSIQGAVSGGSRINRLKYQTLVKSQQQTAKKAIIEKGLVYKPVKMLNNQVNGVYPVMLYKDTGPVYKKNLYGLVKCNERTCNGIKQKCK